VNSLSFCSSKRGENASSYRRRRPGRETASSFLFPPSKGGRGEGERRGGYAPGTLSPSPEGKGGKEIPSSTSHSIRRKRGKKKGGKGIYCRLVLLKRERTSSSPTEKKGGGNSARREEKKGKRNSLPRRIRAPRSKGREEKKKKKEEVKPEPLIS